MLATSCSDGVGRATVARPAHPARSTSTSMSTSTTASTTPVVPSRACDGGVVGPAPESIEVTVDGRDRSATVHVPAEPRADAEPYPVVLSFHGVSGNAAVQQATDGLIDAVGRRGLRGGAPRGTRGRPERPGHRDHRLGSRRERGRRARASCRPSSMPWRPSVCIDTARVYATGFSAGGNIALVLACALPERIAAVAPVAAAYQPGAVRVRPAGADPGVPRARRPRRPVRGSGHRRRRHARPRPRHARRAGAAATAASAIPRPPSCRRGSCRSTWSGCDAATRARRVGRARPRLAGAPDAVQPGRAGRALRRARQPAPEPADGGHRCRRPEAMADNVLLTNDDVDATDLLLAFFEEATPRAG